MMILATVPIRHTMPLLIILHGLALSRSQWHNPGSQIQWSYAATAFQGISSSPLPTLKKTKKIPKTIMTIQQQQQQQHPSCSPPTRQFSTVLHEKEGRDDDDNNDVDDNKDKQKDNTLDIFGRDSQKNNTNQKKKKNYNNNKKKNSFFHRDDNGDNIIEYDSDRIKSCIPYILPLIDGDTFGKYMYERIPALGDVDYVLLRPFVESIHAAPFLSIVLFTAFAIGPRFANLSRDVRFNAQQAVLLDLCLILPTLLGDTIADADMHLPRSILEPTSNFVWYANVSMVIYCISWNLRGKRPDGIPFISSAADYAIGPF